VEARFIGGVEGVPREDWDRLTAEASPFVEWTFLRACEAASAIPDYGVLPQHVTIWDDERLVAALPLYLKGDGRAEFIYDWAWYEFAARVGLHYYPKAVSMSPFTPVIGPHFLVDPQREDRKQLTLEVAAVVERWAQVNELPGVHYLFVTEDEARHLEGVGYLRRLSSQLHWVNEGFVDFAAFLARFRHKDRVKIKRERRRVREQGIEIEVLRGDQICEADLDAMFEFYSRTCEHYGTGSNYLKRGTWELLFREWRDRIVLFMATLNGERVGCSFCVQKGADLYGRYWGSSGEYSCLYFELAFYRPMEHAIHEELERFWVGFGNSRAKFARGLRPAPTHSVHRLFDPKLARVIGAHLEDTRPRIQAQIARARQECKLKRA
jgi:predicted N-acyltransferase